MDHVASRKDSFGRECGLRQLSVRKGMGFRFQRRLKLLPGIHLNFSKSGCSVSVGPKGFKTTLGKRGARMHLGIPGTGIRYEMPLRSGAAIHAATGSGMNGMGERLKRKAIMAPIIETPQMRKIVQKYLAILSGITVFRACYILGALVALVHICRHGGGWVWFFMWLAIGGLIDCLATAIVKELARGAVRTQANIDAAQRRIAQEKHERATLARQHNEAQAWADRCQEVQSLITIQSTFPCKAGEGVLHAEYGALLQETRKVRMPGGGTTDQWTTLDSGTLHVTNRRLVFVGDNGVRHLAIKDIIDTRCDVTSCKVTLANRVKPMGFVADNPCLIVTMITAAQDYPDLPLVPEESLFPSHPG